MMTFTKPSRRRLLKSAIAVVLECWVVASTTVYIGFIVNKGPDPVAPGEYVQLAIMCPAFWGPIAIITLWPVSLP